MTSLHYLIPGRPVPKARPRVVRGRTYTDPRTVAWESTVRAHTMRAVQQAKRAGLRWPLDATYRVELTFRLPDKRRVDGDNLEKSCLDGANGVAWLDDSQVVECSWSKVYGVEPGCVVSVEVVT